MYAFSHELALWIFGNICIYTISSSLGASTNYFFLYFYVPLMLSIDAFIVRLSYLSCLFVRL